ncbi:Peroxisomal D3,D2-enoyl-CoA isomerase [Ceratobasidium theobromae]|uniref:Peroxisomal D3,D2-enoyl-CoA isomerase n=1 Tax=Ceratobasidium theobromae TaxID=1582974 RepID=A0A5N5QRJ7_9AGAM|nr:Peroxisomal D3,D2-enoyl-CoA isomerase [Ceratobasidium theobromae]
MSIPSLHIADGLATIQLNRPKTLNALTADDYEFLSETLRKLDKMPDVLCTIIQASGRAFCSGTDVGARHDNTDQNKSARRTALSLGIQSNTDLSDALSCHSKILIALLNGPAIGIAAAMLGHFDFIYAAPQAWIAVPFSFIGLTSEQNASATFANRMGLAKATEVLLWGKKMTADELERNGFVNQIFQAEDTPSFHRMVRKYLLDRLDGLDPAALLSTKRMIQAAIHEKNDPRVVNFRESFAQAERFAGGVPGHRFGQLARKEIKHRL